MGDIAGGLSPRVRGNPVFARMMAEVLLDPDEIWLGVAAKKNFAARDAKDWVLDRRYIRVSPDNGLMAVLEIGRKWWDAITIYPTQDPGGRSDPTGIDYLRGGKLIWKRK